jgi:hypothetical protein
MSLNNTVTFKFAEVVNTYEDTYKYSTEHVDNLFKIDVQTYGELESRILSARPANPNIKQIPLNGEHVIIFSGLQQESNNSKKRNQWYYLPAYSIQSAINNNALPGVSRLRGDQEDPNEVYNQPLGKSFEEKQISPLQPYEGDLLVEGRFSNSIRLGSTVKENNYTIAPSWSGNENGDPIIIISNGRNNKPNKEFIVESFDNDHASIYLTSTQKLDTISLSTGLTKSRSLNDFNTSQLIGDANRIILRAKSDSIILDTPNRITLNTPDLRIGSESANHPLVKGDELKNILSELINIIVAGVVYTPAGIISTPIQLDKLFTLREKLGNINSKNHYLDK